MISSRIRKAENFIIHLKTSLENTSKDIQKSKQTIQNLKQYQSHYSHQSICVNKYDLQSLHLNINLESPSHIINGDETQKIQHVTINGQKYLKYYDLEQDQQKEDQNNFIKINDSSQNKSQSFEQSVINRFSFAQQKPYIQQCKTNHIFKDGMSYKNKSKEDSIVDQLVQQLKTDKNENNTKTKNRIFKNKHYNKSLNKQQKFVSIKKQLNVVQTGLNNSKDTKNPEQSKYYFKLPQRKQYKQQILENNNKHKQILSRTNIKEQSIQNSFSNFKYHTTKCSKNNIDNLPINLVNHFQKGICLTDNSVTYRTDKFMRKIQSQKRQNYIEQAMKIPGIDRYFNYQQIYNFYLQFKQTGKPYYDWQDFLKNRLRKVGKLLIHQQRFTK